MIDAKLVRFLLVGVANTVFGLSVIWFSMYALGLGLGPANALGYACGLVMSFLLNRNWTFNHSGSQLPAMLRFLLVTAVAYVVQLAVVRAAARLGTNPYVSQMLGTPFYTAVGYLGSRFFAFRSSSPAP